MSLIENTNVWYEKYRPNTLEDMILPEYMKFKIRKYLENGGYDLPHLGLFSRTPGTGKSSLAKVIIKELGAEAIWINASLDRGIDVLRNRIQKFSSTFSLRETPKIAILDEFDQFSREGQHAFRGFIDEFGKNVRFIFTGNYVSNIEPAILDRLEVYDFNQFKMEDIVKPIFQRLVYILEAENIEYRKEDVIEIIKQEYPKIRSMIGALGKNNQDGKLIFHASSGTEVMENLANILKSKDYPKLVPMVYSLGSTDHVYGFYSQHLDLLTSDNANQMKILIILARYQHMSSTARDKHLNLVACLAEISPLL